MTDTDLEQAFSDAAKQARPRPGAVATPAPPPPPPAARRRRPRRRRRSDAPGHARPTRLRPRRSPPVAPLRPPTMNRVSPTCPCTWRRSTCPTPDEEPPDKRPSNCGARPPATLNLAKVFLLYRLPGSEDFGSVEMTRTSKGWYQEQDPQEGRHREVRCSFTSRDATPTRRLGRLQRPLRQPEPDPYPRGGRGLGAELRRRRASTSKRSTPRKTRFRRSSATRADGPSPLPRQGRHVEDRSRHALRQPDLVDRHRSGQRLRLRQGTWPRGAGPTCKETSCPGSAWAGLGHLAPEIGFQITPDFALSLSRAAIKWIGRRSPRSTPSSRPRARQSVLAARALPIRGQSRLRFYGSARLAGGGEQASAPFSTPTRSPASRTSRTPCRGGPILAGLGGGISIMRCRMASRS